MKSSHSLEMDIDLEKVINCPKCHVQMKQIYISRQDQMVLVDSCKKCEGYWFDNEELLKVLDFDTLKMELHFNPSPHHEADFPCPRCKGELETKILFHINVDTCKVCSGIWLDEGELKEIRDEYKVKKQQNKIVDLLQELLEEENSIPS